MPGQACAGHAVLGVCPQLQGPAVPLDPTEMARTLWACGHRRVSAISAPPLIGQLCLHAQHAPHEHPPPRPHRRHHGPARSTCTSAKQQAAWQCWQLRLLSGHSCSMWRSFSPRRTRPLHAGHSVSRNGQSPSWQLWQQREQSVQRAHAGPWQPGPPSWPMPPQLWLPLQSTPQCPPPRATAQVPRIATRAPGQRSGPIPTGGTHPPDANNVPPCP